MREWISACAVRTLPEKRRGATRGEMVSPSVLKRIKTGREKEEREAERERASLPSCENFPPSVPLEGSDLERRIPSA
jgi:hypothetical protein